MNHTYAITYQHAEGEGSTTYLANKPIQTIGDICSLIETIEKEQNVRADLIVWNEIEPKKEQSQ